MGCQTDSDGRLGLPGGLCPAGSPTDGTALPFVSECLLWPACGSPPAPTAHPPPIDSIRVITAVQKTASKTRGVQIACGISLTRLLSVVGLAWLYCTIGELQPIEYLKSVFLEILNVTTWSVFQNKVTYLLFMRTIYGSKICSRWSGWTGCGGTIGGVTGHSPSEMVY